jgi:hypothetical protein
MIRGTMLHNDMNYGSLVAYRTGRSVQQPVKSIPFRPCFLSHFLGSGERSLGAGGLARSDVAPMPHLAPAGAPISPPSGRKCGFRGSTSGPN